jgi:hypothetical protein
VRAALPGDAPGPRAHETLGAAGLVAVRARIPEDGSWPRARPPARSRRSGAPTRTARRRTPARRTTRSTAPLRMVTRTRLRFVASPVPVVRSSRELELALAGESAFRTRARPRDPAVSDMGMHIAAREACGTACSLRSPSRPRAPSPSRPRSPERGSTSCWPTVGSPSSRASPRRCSTTRTTVCRRAPI